ncbi:MAG TPA: Gfo/Idh/MocA family oxidoreductase [Chloroflexota bacterium]|nr:Gfo/Idh/MocA family oxidoreductase [Chloroflexota bacterium]
MLRLGIVDCDTSHVYQFSRRLNHVDIEPDQWVDGAQVVAAYPGTSRVTEPGKVDEYLTALRAAQVELVARPQDLLGRVDAVLIESNEGAVHRERATPFIEAGLPVFIDKPLASTSVDARALVELAAKHGVPLFSASSLRFTPEVRQARTDEAALGLLVGADVFSPATLHPHNPGLFHYGVHGVEMLYALLGRGCRDVTCVFHEDGEVVTGRWNDGRIGVVRGIRRGARGYGLTAYGERAIRQSTVNLTSLYRDLVAVIVPVLSGAPSPISPEELIEVVAFQEAALASAMAGGRPIAMSV